MTSYQLITKLIPEPCGQHDAARKYTANSLVYDGAQAYLSVQDVPAGTALGDSAYWVLFVDASAGGEAMPAYVRQEADSVIESVSAAQTGRCFTFAAITDLHYGNSGYPDGVKHACQALKYIDQRLKLDAVAVLGDYTDGYPASGVQNAFSDFRSVNTVLDGLRFGPNLRIQGNHDFYMDHAPEIHRHIQAYSEDVMWGDRNGGYFYRDFPACKLRIICLNTAETGNDIIYISSKQCLWFADVLRDAGTKEDAAEWQILVLSHHPVDWSYADGSYAFAGIMNAYKTGDYWSGTVGGEGVSMNTFEGKNAARLIGNIHGHIHNLLVDRLYSMSPASPDAVQYDIYRMCTPEACINRSNQYDGVWKEPESYPKVKNSAQDTSFVIYCIDLDACTIQAVCYGAGYDRRLLYTATSLQILRQPVSVTVKEGETATVSVSAQGTGLTYQWYFANAEAPTVFYPSSTATGDNYSVEMNAERDGRLVYCVITDSNGNTIQTDTVTLSMAASDAPSGVTNLIPWSVDSDGTPYNGGLGYKRDYRISTSSGAESSATGYACTGFIPVKSGDVIYGSPGILKGDNGWVNLSFYDSAFARLWGHNLTTLAEITTFTQGEDESFSFGVSESTHLGTNALAKIAYFRMGSQGIYSGDAVITVNEPIV